MIDQGLIEAIAYGFGLLVAVLVVPAGIYVFWVYRHLPNRRDSDYLRKLVRNFARGWIGVLMLLYLVAGSAFHWLSRPWGSLILDTAMVLLMWGLLDVAHTFYRDRHPYDRPRRFWWWGWWR